MPSTKTSHGKSCEVGSLGVAMEFLRSCLQRAHGQIVRGRQDPPKICRALWHDYDRRNTAAIGADGGADAHVRLQQAVVATLAGSVKKENHRPFLARHPILRNKYLVFMIDALNCDAAVEEAGLVFLCGSGGCKGQRQR